MTIEYSPDDADRLAWAAIDRSEDVDILILGSYGWACPALLVVYKHAALAGMRAPWHDADGTLVVSFRSGLDSD